MKVNIITHLLPTMMYWWN